MPTYVYKAKTKGCEYCRDGFEHKQGINEPPIAKCPQCGAAVERIICAPFIQTGPSDRTVLSDKNLKKHGFTKLVNEGDGKYRQT